MNENQSINRIANRVVKRVKSQPAVLPTSVTVPTFDSTPDLQYLDYPQDADYYRYR
jgi:hypothetical protein